MFYVNRKIPSYIFLVKTYIPKQCIHFCLYYSHSQCLCLSYSLLFSDHCQWQLATALAQTPFLQVTDSPLPYDGSHSDSTLSGSARNLNHHKAFHWLGFAVKNFPVNMVFCFIRQSLIWDKYFSHRALNSSQIEVGDRWAAFLPLWKEVIY